MTQQTKNLEEKLIQAFNKRAPMDEKLEGLIRSTLMMAFQQGYGECLEDVREGLIE